MKNPHAVALGVKGGKVKSEKKRAAIEENLRLARLKRWPKVTCDDAHAEKPHR